jgi:hypothetical protein
MALFVGPVLSLAALAYGCGQKGGETACTECDGRRRFGLRFGHGHGQRTATPTPISDTDTDTATVVCGGR